MILALTLPLRSSMTTNAPHVLIACMSLSLAVAMPPDACAFLRRNHRPHAALGNRVIALAVIVASVTRDLPQLRLDLRQQLREHLPVAVVVRRHHSRPNLARSFINSDVQLAPCAPPRPSMLTDFPFTFAIDFDAGRIHHQMQRRTLRTLGQGDFQPPSSPTRASCNRARQE